MPVYLGSDIRPKNGMKFFLMEDIYLKGGLQLRADVEDRDSILAMSLKVGMFVYTMAEKTMWQLESKDPVTWKEFSFGGGSGSGPRNTFIQVVDNLEVGGTVDVDVEIAPSAVCFKLEVSRKVRVEIHGTPERSDTNPYVFLATDDHLADDGRTMMTDGTVLPMRRYSILANLEDPVKNMLYLRIVSVDQIAGPVSVTMIYKPLE